MRYGDVYSPSEQRKGSTLLKGVVAVSVIAFVAHAAGFRLNYHSDNDNNSTRPDVANTQASDNSVVSANNNDTRVVTVAPSVNRRVVVDTSNGTYSNNGFNRRGGLYNTLNSLVNNTGYNSRSSVGYNGRSSSSDYYGSYNGVYSSGNTSSVDATNPTYLGVDTDGDGVADISFTDVTPEEFSRLSAAEKEKMLMYYSNKNVVDLATVENQVLRDRALRMGINLTDEDIEDIRVIRELQRTGDRIAAQKKWDDYERRKKARDIGSEAGARGVATIVKKSSNAFGDKIADSIYPR